MRCLLGHHYIKVAEGTGGYAYCGVKLSSGMDGALMVCTKCGNKKVVIYD